MKLQYKVLWFDDSDELFDSLDWDYLRGRISEWGFVPDVQLVTTPEAFRSKAPYDDYDLLVVDYNLEGYGEGQDFILQVREQEVFTEIIFYSSGATSMLWDAVHSHKLEGIYIANKDTILERILKVGQQTLRKVLDLENMRGIVMAEVGDLDLLLNKILAAAIRELPPEGQADVFKRFYEASNEHHAKHKTSLEEFNNSPTIELLLSLCDSDKRWQNYNRAKKHHGVLKKAMPGDYVAEILRPRNFLAHGVPNHAEDGSCVFEYQGKEYTFSDAVSTALRTRIITFKTAFMEIHDALVTQKSAS
ncbi:hypothetical protein ACSFA7_13140 [Variovorax sp. LT1R20]|uniref:hypothetical protein n=1 Tax=Variovorax sp. LT1R20 TaxID=3443729 RepID=UPI003F4564E9